MTVKILPIKRDERIDYSLEFTDVKTADGSKYPLLRLYHESGELSVDIIVPNNYYVVYEGEQWYER